MYFESKLYLKKNYTLNELREIFCLIINRTNDIERVLIEMECISPSLIDDLRGDCIYAFITTNYYYLFRYEPCIVIAHIELYDYPLMCLNYYICTKYIENEFYRFCKAAS